MKVLVTGGLGFVGSNLVDLLINHDYDVHVVDDLSSGTLNNKNDSATYYIASISDLFFKNLDIRYDCIFHLAAEARIQPSFKNPKLWYKTNCVGTVEVCEYARRFNSRVVFAGSSSCFGGEYRNPYTFTKKQGEDICKMYSAVYNISTVTARFFNVYGPRNPLIGEFTPIIAKFEQQTKMNTSLTIVGDGEQRRDFTHVEDICRGLLALSEFAGIGEVFNLGTGINYSINEIADMFGGDKVYLPSRPGEARETLADTSKIRQCTGWESRRSLSEYIQKFINNNKMER